MNTQAIEIAEYDWPKSIRAALLGLFNLMAVWLAVEGNAYFETWITIWFWGIGAVLMLAVITDKAGPFDVVYRKMYLRPFNVIVVLLSCVILITHDWYAGYFYLVAYILFVSANEATRQKLLRESDGLG